MWGPSRRQFPKNIFFTAKRPQFPPATLGGPPNKKSSHGGSGKTLRRIFPTRGGGAKGLEEKFLGFLGASSGEKGFFAIGGSTGSLNKRIRGGGGRRKSEEEIQKSGQQTFIGDKARENQGPRGNLLWTEFCVFVWPTGWGLFRKFSGFQVFFENCEIKKTAGILPVVGGPLSASRVQMGPPGGRFLVSKSF